MAKQANLSLFQRRRGVNVPPLKLFEKDKGTPDKVRSKILKLFFFWSQIATHIKKMWANVW